MEPGQQYRHCRPPPAEPHGRQARGSDRQDICLESLFSFLQAQGVCFSGTAHISGDVENDINRDLALDIARGVNGINIVKSNIVISDHLNTQPLAPASTAIDDATITLTIRSKLYWSQTTDGLPIAVETEQGRVILRGNVDKAAARIFAGTLALSTRGVAAVDNRLVVNGKAAAIREYETEPNGGINASLSDNWITARVKTAFLYSVGIFKENIEVRTLSGTVILSGALDTEAERNLAIELARHTRGVEHVHAEELTFQQSTAPRMANHPNKKNTSILHIDLKPAARTPASLTGPSFCCQVNIQ
ncbi:BON domain-containing protein [Chromobacterium vaccinii]|uniref:BON domain-containing protein n=1 Tax=Chromobacterium vaccinii TaxID=1108595 RepID=UPI000E208DCA|nr:BON domain-containing protein [Chromobacterium vaccinii]